MLSSSSYDKAVFTTTYLRLIASALFCSTLERLQADLFIEPEIIALYVDDGDGLLELLVEAYAGSEVGHVSPFESLVASHQHRGPMLQMKSDLPPPRQVSYLLHDIHQPMLIYLQLVRDHCFEVSGARLPFWGLAADTCP